MTDENEKFVQQVAAFAETYLFEKLNEAGVSGENPNIALYALMECMGIVKATRVDAREESP